MKRGPMILLFAVCLGIICTIVVYTERSKIPNTPVTVFLASTPQNSSIDSSALSKEIINESAEVVQTSSDICHDINQATASDLQRVDGIGEKLSAAIIAYRDALGGFINRSQLLDISGIGEKLADALMSEFFIPNEQPISTTISSVHTTTVHTTRCSTAIPSTSVRTTVSTSLSVTTETTIVCTAYYDINIVSREELLTIPDMDESQADAIISLRSDLGRFQNLRELALIPNFPSQYILDVLPNYLYVTNDNSET